MSRTFWYLQRMQEKGGIGAFNHLIALYFLLYFVDSNERLDIPFERMNF